MPRISRLFIKTGLIYFLLAIILRLILDVFQLLPAFILRPLFWHALMLGWITQIIMGVSMWMFPGRNKEDGFKAQKWAWLTYFCLNTGLVLRFISSPLVSFYHRTFWEIILAISAVILLGAIVFFVIELWPRVMSKEKQREKRKAKRKKRKRNQKQKEDA